MLTIVAIGLLECFDDLKTMSPFRPTW